MLQLTEVEEKQDIDIKLVREQYLKLAQKYHPDTSDQSNQEQVSANEETFIRVKESFERLVFLDKDSKGQLFVSARFQAKVQKKEEAKAAQMDSLKHRVKL